MLFVSLPIFVVDTEIIYGYNLVAPFKPKKILDIISCNSNARLKGKETLKWCNLLKVLFQNILNLHEILTVILT